MASLHTVTTAGSAAMGWSVYPRPYFPGSFCWSAYGPRGGTHGTASSEAAAVALAKRAHEDLRRPVLRSV